MRETKVAMSATYHCDQLTHRRPSPTHINTSFSSLPMAFLDAHTPHVDHTPSAHTCTVPREGQPTVLTRARG
eukprot:m.237708 g.237708  ORF g.237708 m.237708 type:complete len:72 (+) comp47620_c0_seq1:6-221(+)